MKFILYTAVILLSLCCSKVYNMKIEEPCRHDAYPPKEILKVPSVILNLDLPPHERWQHIVKPKKDQMIDLISVLKDILPQKIVSVVDDYMGYITDWLPQPYADEIKGVAAATDIPLGEVLLYNIFYEIFTACTSIVAEDEEGKLYHGRNLDFGLFMGWDIKNNTWVVTEKLRPLIMNVDYQKNGTTVFRSVHFAGYVGVMTAVKPKMFTFTLNERFALDGGQWGIIQWVLGLSKGKWVGFLARDVMLNANSYSMAKEMLEQQSLLAPVYFILGGTKSGEGTIITRSKQETINTLDLNLQNGIWYVLETNYDNWEKPLFFDDRRTPGKKCMKEMTQKSVGFKGLFNVMSTKPTLNKLTAYTTLMQVDDGTLDTYLQNCPDPCWPW